MAGRIRTQKPEVFEDTETATLTDAAWRLYTGMKSMADDWGNLRAVPAQLAGFVFWAQTPPPDVLELLGELARKKVIQRYEVDGLPYAAIVGWNTLGHPRHENVDKKSRTRRVPAPASEVQPFLPIAGARGTTLATVSREPREGLATPSAPDLDHDRDPTGPDPISTRTDPARPRAIPAAGPGAPTDPATPDDIRALVARHTGAGGRA